MKTGQGALPPPTRRPNRQIRVVRRPSEWPLNDRLLWEAALTKGDIFDEQGAGADLSATTIDRYAWAYGRWIAFLAASDPQALQLDPAARFSRSRIEAFCRALAETNQAASVAICLRHLHGAMRLLAPNDNVRWLLPTANRIATATPSRRRNRFVLTPTLYKLGLELMREAAKKAGEIGRISSAIAEVYRDGLVIAVLALAPMRLRGLTALTLGTNVIKTRSAWTIALAGDDVKNGRDIEYAIATALTPAFDAYVAAYRPVLAQGTHSEAMWLSRKTGGRLSSVALRDLICRRTEQRLGTRVSPHQFRSAALTFWALSNPAQIRSAGELLGHVKPETGERYYNMAASVEAARVMVRLLE
jgi:integrase